MIGAVVVAGFGARVGADGEAETFRGGFDDGIEGGALGAGDFHVLGKADGSQGVIVEVHGNFRGGYRRMLAEIFGAEQALLFSGDAGEEDRARRRSRGGPGLRDFQQMPQPVPLSTAPL
jgi:hypothetical protein